MDNGSDFNDKKAWTLAVVLLETIQLSTACVLLEYGAEKDGYWNSQCFNANVKHALMITKYKCRT